VSGYDDTLLAARFAVLAPDALPGDWTDVARRAGAGGARNGRGRLQHPDALPRGRRRLVVVLAVMVLVAVVSASALAVRAFIIDKGFIGLPPVGARPSAPTGGNLVLSAYGVARGSRTQIWVYADGRLIWRREHPTGADIRAGANRESTGLLEQRLTQRGVARLLSEARSTGLLGRGFNLSVGAQPCANIVEVRGAGGPERVTWHGSQCPGEPLGPAGTKPATARQARTLLSLMERLAYPASWLPGSLWTERRTRGYVPARFEVWYGPWPLGGTYSDALARLPAPVQRLLRAQPVRRLRGLVGSPVNLVPAYDYHVTVTTKEARALRTALANAGLEVDWTAEDVVLSYRVGERHPGAAAVSITFVPILPDGEPAGPGG
jgi:hypothetical protein